MDLDCHRDDQTRFEDNGGSSPVCQPNNFGGPADDAGYAEPPLRIDGGATRLRALRSKATGLG